MNTGVGSLPLLQAIFLNPGIEPKSPALQVDFLPAELPGRPILSTYYVLSAWTVLSDVNLATTLRVKCFPTPQRKQLQRR